MTMALVNGAVSSKEIEIFFAFHVPNINTFALFEDNGNGVVIVSAKIVLQFH
jgi:hypothetical protein